KRYKERTDKPTQVVVKYKYSLDTQKVFLVDYMKENKRVAFESVFSQCENRIHAIFTFLAMLELVQQRYLGLLIGSGRNNFIVEWNPEAPDESPLNFSDENEEKPENNDESEDLAQ
ncbi:MAG: hypothetical protein KDC11_12315, partial [Chitinophagaceae bacterium]|nr:hypothetical protein [Chitinophagaceae bacterium]